MGWGCPHNLNHSFVLEGTHDSGAQTQGLCLEKDVLADVACLNHSIPHTPVIRAYSAPMTRLRGGLAIHI